jgi:hypothetical protein
MPGCYICGASVPSGSGLRRKLRTGTSVGGMALTSRPVLDWALNSLLKRRAVSIRNTYSLCTVCASCAQSLDHRRANQNKIVVRIAVATIAIVAIIGVAILVR